MGDEEAATLDGQFYEFARLSDSKRDGTTINLYRSDYWLRQTKLLEDRKLTMTDTGILFNKFKHGLLQCNFRPVPMLAPDACGEVVTQNCPPAKLSDTSQSAFRRCGESGMWLGRRPNESGPVGWTNYTPCFPPEVQTLLLKIYNDEKRARSKFEIAQCTRYMEIAGFSISMVALIISLFIFSYYRSLRNNRTRIHKSLFWAMLVQVVIRLTVYIDQEVTTNRGGDQSSYGNVTLKGINNMPIVCESSYVLLEYAISVMFMWMFIEGLYLHNVVTANALREKISYLVYYATGWGVPLVMTAIWATMTAIHYQREGLKTCWYGYNFSPLYWIAQGPRLAVIIINLLFLLNIMRVLIMKLRQTQSTEIEKVRKAVRAALVLLPLLGITNILNMLEAPLDSSVWVFGLWSYTTHFLRSFQGFFIALIYCFLNGEVRTVVRKHYEDYRAVQGVPRPPRASSCAENRSLRKESKVDGETSSWVQMRSLKWKRSSSKENKETSDTEIGAEGNLENMKTKVDRSIPEEIEVIRTADRNRTETVAEVNV